MILFPSDALFNWNQDVLQTCLHGNYPNPNQEGPENRAQNGDQSRPAYDPTNVFARILRGEVPCRKIAENEAALAFYDAFPKAKVHGLIIPKGAYQTAGEFFSQASPQEILGFCALVSQMPSLLGVSDSRYRLVANAGTASGQEVPHFHMHLLAGQPLGGLT